MSEGFNCKKHDWYAFSEPCWGCRIEELEAPYRMTSEPPTELGQTYLEQDEDGQAAIFFTYTKDDLEFARSRARCGYLYGSAPLPIPREAE